MSFLSVRDFKQAGLGCDLSWASGPDGDYELFVYLEKSLSMIEDYLGVTLRWHIKDDESHAVLNRNLACFPEEMPLRSIWSFTTLAAAVGGKRQTWTIPTMPVETTQRPGSNGLMYGNVEVDRGRGLLQVTSYAGAMGFPWATVVGAASEILITYTAGYDFISPYEQTTMVVASSSVAAAPAPTAASFNVQPGDGQWFRTGVRVTIAGVSNLLTGINGDALLFATPWAAAPAPGAAVTQGDGVVLKAPRWLVEMQRDVARHVVEVRNKTAQGAWGARSIVFGQVQIDLSSKFDLDLPDGVKERLDRRQESLAGELA